MNERLTENLFEIILQSREINKKNGYIIEMKISGDPSINKLLSKASKNKTGNKGYPEFIIQHKNRKDIVYVVECKGDVKLHSSINGDQPQKTATDGVLHYARYISEKFNVVAIAFSGDDHDHRLDSYFIQKKEDNKISLPINIHSTDNSFVPSIEDIENIIENPQKYISDGLQKISKNTSYIHNILRENMKVSDDQKALLISIILLALKDYDFKKTYYHQKNDYDLFIKIKRSIEDTFERIEESKGSSEKKMVILDLIKSIESNKNIANKQNTFFKEIVSIIDHDIWPNLKMHNNDYIGEFYTEFLKYTDGNKKGLGIVLTPHHVTDFFAELANLNENSVILDPATGTGGFLIASMKNLWKKVISEKKREELKKNSFVGIEADNKMFALASINMILRGDGHSNIFYDSCFNKDTKEKIKKLRPNVGMINPPYSQKDFTELRFVENMLDMLQPGGIGIAIIPVSNLISKSNNLLKKEIMKKHTLLGSISMPNQLFYPVGTITNIVFFEAKKPHIKSQPVWLCYGKEDGFELKRHIGRVPRDNSFNKWNKIKEKWIKSYKNKKEIPGEVTIKNLSYYDEWSVEAHLTPDFSSLCQKDFDKVYADMKIAELKEMND